MRKVYNLLQKWENNSESLGGTAQQKILDGDGNLIAAIFTGVGRWNSFEIDMLWVEEP